MTEDCTSVGFTGEGRCIEPAGTLGLCDEHRVRMLRAMLSDALYESRIGEYGYLGRPECDQFVEPLLPVVERLLAEQGTQAWQESAEATADWMATNPGPSGIPHDPPTNPYDRERGGSGG
jgi:hypothetical protein